MALGEGRKGPYSTIYHDWIPKLFKSRRLGVTSTAVFMLLCERLEFGYDEDGNRFAFASYSRKKMSDVLGASEIAVKRATDHLKEAGIIEVYQSGRKGSATVYAIMPSTPWPDRETEGDRR